MHRLQRYLAPLRFIRHALRGHWLAPWRSPYLRWRIETYSGLPAETVNAAVFFQFLSSEKGQLLRFLSWVAEMETYRQNVGG
jgi:hypothetical protein